VGRDPLARRAGDPCLALGWQTLRIEGLHWTLSIAGLRLPVIARDGLRDRLATAQADLARVTAAQQARADQAAANHHPAAVSARIAEISDAQASRYYAQGRAAGAAWAAAHSLHDACPARGPQTPLCPEPITLPRSMTDPVTLPPGCPPRADFDLCTANSARLAQMHQDALALIAQGVAVPAP
jgi:uncharacterized membrane protein